MPPLTVDRGPAAGWLDTVLARAAGTADRLRQRIPGLHAQHWLFIGGLYSNVFSGNSQYLGLPISLDRVLFPLALTFLLLDSRRSSLRLRPVHVLMVVFVLWTVYSMAASGNIADSVAQYALLDRTAVPFIMFVTGPLFFDTPARRDALLFALSGLGAYLGVTALLEMVAPSAVLPRYIVNPSLGMQYGRARGPFVASEAMGMALMACCFSSILAAVRATGTWRWVCGSVAAVCFLGNVLALTRSVWLGAVVAVLAGAFLLPASVRRYIPRVLGLVVATTAFIAALMPSLVVSLADRLGEKESVYDRLGSNDAALRLLVDRPLTGIGWRRFFPYGADWVRQDDAYPINAVVIEIHSVILSRAAELGIPAAVVFVAIMVLGPLRGLWVPAAGDLVGWRVLGLAAFTLWFVTGLFGPLALPFPNYTCWLLVGIASAPYVLRGHPDSPMPALARDCRAG